MASPIVTKLEQNYRYATGATGGYASELYEVKYVDPLQALEDQATTAGLPKDYAPHPLNPNLQVRERVIELVIDNQTTIVRVDYRPASFDVGVIQSISESTEVRPLRLIWGSNGQLTSPEGGDATSGGWVLRGGPGDENMVVKLYTTVRRYSVLAGGSVDQVSNAIIGNKGRWYKIGSYPNERIFVFVDGKLRRLKDGRVYAEYFFETHPGFAAIPAGTYPGQIEDIPECPPAGMVFTRLNFNTGPEYAVKTVLQLYKPGLPLPGFS